jgi:dUTP pyrophosphatase
MEYELMETKTGDLVKLPSRGVSVTNEERGDQTSLQEKIPSEHTLVVYCKGVVPQRNSPEACGYDLKCNEYTVTLEPKECKLIKTGTFVEIPKGYYGKIESRSSIAWKQNCHVGAGVIDSDYRGEVMVLLRNDSDKTVIFTKNDRIAQLIILKHEIVLFISTDKLNETERNDGGFGSTGR